MDLSNKQLNAIYMWINTIPFSRHRKNIARDFSDGVLIAEILKVYLPQLVDLHNYYNTCSIRQKINNFDTLNRKILRKLNYNISSALINDIVHCKELAVESLLNELQYVISDYRENNMNKFRKCIDYANTTTMSVDNSMINNSFQSNSHYNSSNGNDTDNNKYSEGNNNMTMTHSTIHQSKEAINTSSIRSMTCVNKNESALVSNSKSMVSIDEEILLEKERVIIEQQEVIEILKLKVARLEEMIMIKDRSIAINSTMK